MVYEQLTVIWNHHSVPLDNYGLKFITVVNPSLLGIRLLATSRFVNEEAGSILKPALARMLQPPPTLLIEVKDIISVMSTSSSFVRQRNLLDDINRGLYRNWTTKRIHQYRKGQCSLRSLRLFRDLRRDVDLPDAAIIALTSFLLRAQKLRTTAFDSPTRYPPIAIAISIPSTFISWLVVVRTSLPIRLFCKLFGAGRPSLSTVQANTRQIVAWFARQTTISCDF